MELLASFDEYPPFDVLGQLTTLRADKETELATISLDINIYNGLHDYEIEYEIKKPHDYLKEFTAFLEKAGIEYVPNRISKYKRFTQTMK